MDRRQFMGRCVAAACVGWIGPKAWAQEVVPPATTRGGFDPDQFKTIRGFNYQPSYEATGYAIWRYFNAERIDLELARGKRFFPKMTTLRIWLSFDAFAAEPQTFADNFETLLRLLSKHGLNAIPTLFNNWHSVPDFGGISDEMLRYWFVGYGKRGSAASYVFRPYLEAIVGGHARDKRITAWDLCNQPFKSGDPTLTMEWLKHTYQTCMALGAVQPIGASGGPSLEEMKRLEPMSDVLMFHAYRAAECPLGEIVMFARSRRKPLLATECCPGEMDDALRAKAVESDLRALKEHGIGFLAHVLHESLVADCHRSQYGPMSSAGYTAFINMDGSLRRYHDVFNKF